MLYMFLPNRGWSRLLAVVFTNVSLEPFSKKACGQSDLRVDRRDGGVSLSTSTHCSGAVPPHCSERRSCGVLCRRYIETISSRGVAPHAPNSARSHAFLPVPWVPADARVASRSASGIHRAGHHHRPGCCPCCFLHGWRVGQTVHRHPLAS